MDEEVRRTLEQIRREGTTLQEIWDVQTNNASRRVLPTSVRNRLGVLIFARGYSALETTLKAMLAQEAGGS